MTLPTPSELANLRLAVPLLVTKQPAWLRWQAVTDTTALLTEIAAALDLGDDATAGRQYAHLLVLVECWQSFDYHRLPPPLPWLPGETSITHFQRELATHCAA